MNSRFQKNLNTIQNLPGEPIAQRPNNSNNSQQIIIMNSGLNISFIVAIKQKQPTRPKKHNKYLQPKYSRAYYLFDLRRKYYCSRASIYYCCSIYCRYRWKNEDVWCFGFFVKWGWCIRILVFVLGGVCIVFVCCLLI